MSSALPPGALRVSDAEREPVVERLQQAFAEGRLDKAEFDVRLQLAMTAKNRTDLAAILADLPSSGTDSSATIPAQTHADPSAEDRVLAAVAHGLGAMTLFLGPLFMLCVAGRRSPYVREHIVSALNFQLTLLIVTIVTFGLGAIAYAVSWIIVAIAALIALAGTNFRYPFTLRLVR